MGFAWQNNNHWYAQHVTLKVKYLLTEFQRYEQHQINLSMTESIDDKLGPKQNTKILNFLNLNNLINKI